MKMQVHSQRVVGVYDKRFPDKMIKHSNVQDDIKIHKITVNK